MRAISGYEVLTRFFLAFDTWFVLLLNSLVNHDLSYRHFTKCSASFGHTIMRHCQTYIHIQINACHVHLGFAQLDKAFEPRKKARTGGSSTWAMGCNLIQPGAGGPFHPSTYKSIHDIKHYQTIPSTFDYRIHCDSAIHRQGHLPKNRYAGQRHHSDWWGTNFSGSWHVMAGESGQMRFNNWRIAGIHPVGFCG